MKRYVDVFQPKKKNEKEENKQQQQQRIQKNIRR